ncbi:MAG TPA: hypothetical protein VL742_14570 [Casimicrobiaceae bacterium]|nr:hypothetical protein [Casimicrobiaceae bacterium]
MALIHQARSRQLGHHSMKQLASRPETSRENGTVPGFGWKRGAELIAAIAAWIWFIVAGCGGLGLIITTGPWPPTHGWFAMLSGIAAWPVTAWASKKYLRVSLSWRVRLGAAAMVMLAGRLAVDFIWPRPDQPPHRPDWVAVVSGTILFIAVLATLLAHTQEGRNA